MHENHLLAMLINKEIAFRFLAKYIFLFFVTGASAQQWLPDFKHFTPQDGLPSSEVYQINSDPQNNLWFATDRGAVRYDGYSFRTYEIKDSLPDNSIIKLYKDQEERIWFISYNSLISYYKDGKIHPFKYNNIIRSKLSNTLITSLFVDKSDNVSLNTINGTLYTITAEGKFIVKEKSLPTSLYVINSTHTSSVTTNYLVGRVDSITAIRVENLRDTFSFRINEPIIYQHFATYKLRNNDLIFYCERFLIRIRPSGAYEVKKYEAPILNVFEDEDNRIWVGTNHDGVYVCDSLLNVTSHYLRDVSVSHIYKDFEGGIWFSTLENGIFYLSSKNSSCFGIRDKPLLDKITAISNVSDSVLFFTTSNRVLYRYNSFKNTIDDIDLRKQVGPAIEYINAIHYNNSAKELVIGVVIKFGVVTADFYLSKWMHNSILILPSGANFIRQSNGNILGSLYEFAYSFNPDSKTFRFVNDHSFRSKVFFEDSKHRLFSGSWDGLYILKNKDFVRFDTTAELLSSRITAINELFNKFLVIGTRSNGIVIYSDSIIKHIVTADGLSSDYINCIAVDGNTIWAGTNKGISRITVTNKAPFTFTIDRFSISNGLNSDDIIDIAIDKKGIYAATNEGLNFIKKEQKTGNNHSLPLYITTIRINDHDTILASSYSLTHQQNNIDISFTALSFRNSKNITYKYRLLGPDTTWRTTFNRNVQFSGLPSGNYKFQLLAAGENGSVSDSQVVVYFSIAPSFYEMGYFRFLVATFFLLTIIGIANYRIRWIQKKAEEKNALNKKFSELNLNALRSQMNPHFTFNVLNSIKYYIAKNDPESAQLYISKFSKLIRLILDQSRTEYITLSEEIEMLRLYMELEELRFENKFTYAINIDEKLNSEEIEIPGMLIQPFVENSIKHGIRFKKGEARVEVHFSSSDAVLICTITDNGIGREEAAKLKSPDEEYKSMGTAIVSERIEALSILYKGKLKNYTIDLKDEHGNPVGTSVKIEIPFKRSSR